MAITARQAIHALMFPVKLYEKFYAESSYYTSSGGGKPFTYGSTKYTLKSPCNTINFIGEWLQTLKKYV